MKIKNWSKYQSYKDRLPPWIRFHRTVLDDYKYQKMTAESRALLPMLWLLACEHEDPTSGIVDLSVEEIAFRLRQKEKIISTSLKEIQDAEFIECTESVTIPLRDRTQTVTPETETETETETENKTLSCLDSKKPESRPVKFSSEDYKFAEKMFDQIIEEFPNLERSYRKNYDKRLEGWANEIRKMREIDLKDVSQINRIWEWARNDDFWKINIQSASTLRKQFEKLTIRANGTDPWDRVEREEI